jgi:NADH-quinone oxidoreductase subunit L
VRLITPPLAGVLPDSFGTINAESLEHSKHTAELIAMGAMLAGLVIATLLYAIDKGRMLARFKQTSLGSALYYWCYNGLGFDALYDLVFVKPFMLIGRLLKSDPVDKTWNIFPALALVGNRVFGWVQSGSLRGYAASFGVGMAVLLVLVMMMIGK